MKSMNKKVYIFQTKDRQAVEESADLSDPAMFTLMKHTVNLTEPTWKLL